VWEYSRYCCAGIAQVVLYRCFLINAVAGIIQLLAGILRLGCLSTILTESLVRYIEATQMVLKDILKGISSPG
jgi:hypothetical protein